MTKLLTIDVDHDKERNEIIFIVKVIADSSQSILVIKDLIDERGKKQNIKCYGVKLHHCKQYATTTINNLAISGEIYVRPEQPEQPDEIPNAMNKIANIILNFIL